MSAVNDGYTPNLKHPDPANVGVAGELFTHGTGAPGADVPSWSIGYIDDATGTVYVRSGGVWQAIGGNVSGVTGVYTRATDPTGALSVAGAAICLGTGALDGTVWKKTSAGTGTDWTQM